MALCAPKDTIPSVVAVIVNWNTRELLRECLAEVTDDGAQWLHVLCIDNASTDGSADMVAHEFPSVLLVRNDGNLGFARAVNQGIAVAMEKYRPEFLALVNSDAVVTTATLAALASQLQREGDAAAISPALRSRDGHLQSGAAGVAPTVWSGICYFLFLSALTRGRCRGVFIDQRHFIGRQQPVCVDWVSAACAVVRTEAVRRVGDIDSSFFMYAEDVEWFCRMRRAGYAVWYFPALDCIHHHGGSSPQVNSKWIASLCSLVRRDRGTAAYVVFRLVAAVGLSVRYALYTLAYLTVGSERHRNSAAAMAVYARWALDFRNPVCL